MMKKTSLVAAVTLKSSAVNGNTFYYKDDKDNKDNRICEFVNIDEHGNEYMDTNIEYAELITSFLIA